MSGSGVRGCLCGAAGSQWQESGAGAGSVPESSPRAPSGEAEAAHLPVSLQVGFAGLSGTPGTLLPPPRPSLGAALTLPSPRQHRPQAEGQPARRAGRAAAAERGAVPDAGAVRRLRGESAASPRSTGTCSPAVPTQRTWRQGPGRRHHRVPLPAGDQQAAVPSRAVPGSGAALPRGSTGSAGGSSPPQADAAVSQGFLAGANKPLPHLGQA